MNENERVLLVDGMSLLFRGYYAMPMRKTSQGVPINAIYQWIRYFHDAFQTFQPTRVVCCWDVGAKTFRNELYKAYKANRGEPPEDLVPQFELIKEIVEESFFIPNVGVVGFEADDVIGTLSTMYGKSMDVVILTGDHDNLQLVNDRVKVAIMKRGMGNYKVYCPDVLNEEKGITPSQFIDVKAIMGDSSDNIPGVKGIGEVGALKLIKQYRDLTGILNNLEELTPSMRSKIETNLDMLHLSKDLVTIRCDVPLEHRLEESVWEVDPEQMRKKFKQFELTALNGIF